MSLIQSNAVHIPLKNKSVQLCAFSPPYWGLRKYSVLPMIWGGVDAGCRHEWGNEKFIKNTPPRDHDGPNAFGSTRGKEPQRNGTELKASQGQYCPHCNAWRGDLGLEPDPRLYLHHMMQVMAEVERVLRDDGVCFVNIGDSYYGGGRAGNNPEYFGKHKMFGKAGWDTSVFGKPMKTPLGMKAKSLCLIPQKFAIKCQEMGWIIRAEIIWAKPNPRPESCKDRPTRSHEQVWMMTKQGRYYWDRDAVRETPTGRIDTTRYWRKNDPVSAKTEGCRNDGERVYYPDGKKGANRKDVWIIATEPTSKDHFASWPSRLVNRMIRAASKPGDIVLDPFCGTGKTVIEAEKLNRVGIGLDLSWEYLSEIAMPWLNQPIQRELAAL